MTNRLVGENIEHIFDENNASAVLGSTRSGSEDKTNQTANYLSQKFSEGLSSAWQQIETEGQIYWLPILQEWSGIYKAITKVLKQIQVDGFITWNQNITFQKMNATATTPSIVKDPYSSKLYKSLVDDNKGNSLTDNTKWELICDLEDLNLVAQNLKNFNGASQIVKTNSSGLIEANNIPFATQLEVNAGTDNTKAVTPLTLQTKFNFISLGRIIATRNTSNFRAIDFSSGRFDFADGSGSAVLSAITKLFTATWTQGTNAGILDTGTLQNNRWYKCFTIYNPTLNSTDVIATLDTNALPTLPSGWAKPTLHSVQYFDGTDLIPLDHVDKYKFNFLDERGQFSEPTRNATFRPLCPAMKCEIEVNIYQDTDDYYGYFVNEINSKYLVLLQFHTGTAPERKGSSATLYTNSSGNVRYNFDTGSVFFWRMRYNSLTIYDNQN